MEIVLATGNPHKLEELRSILAPTGATLLGLQEASHAAGIALPEEPDESGATFPENARIKAIAYAAVLRRPCLADDSGLEVDALGGEPGVHSAHWAGREGDRAERDRRNNEKLLAALRNVPPERRTARFVCCMCLADPSGRVLQETRGVFEGVVLDSPRGTHGFGYDPLLWLPDRGCTSAELSPEEKNARSHRGAAAQAMAAWLEGASALLRGSSR